MVREMKRNITGMAAKRKNDIEREPWERQEGETYKQYEAFCTYRDLGLDRSQTKVSEQLSKSRALISRWSSMNNWVERCRAWDTEQDRLNRIQQIKEIRQMRKKHATIASSMLVKAAKALNSLKEEDIKAQDISRMVEVASKLERLSRGDVGEVVEERDGGKAEPPVVFYIPDNNRD